MKHDFGRKLEKIVKDYGYKEKDMINEAAKELCRSLELTNEKVATLAARKYLIKKGYSIIRINWKKGKGNDYWLHKKTRFLYTYRR